MSYGGGCPSWVHANRTNQARAETSSAHHENSQLKESYESKISTYKDIVKKMRNEESLSETQKQFLKKELE